ncbi:Fanconi anemia group M protein homolog [Rhopilema esculentum]|uniref:Fanconi anemia group M protein homolog n=1 Tax=Rhopilema esculentum TaxID=499914 RepID=UPI0031D0B7E9
MPKSSQSQATLFQTWGYSGNTHTEPLQHPENKISKKKEKCESKKGKSAGQAGNRSLIEKKTETEKDNIAECLENDDVIELCEAIEKTNKDTFLDKNHNPNCTPENLPGFDSSSGHNYIYPINYPIREYQFRIIKEALVQNTLVVLPTGLGKTFIAAVVMYNFYRWYPRGKILFMAPTKPLVAQQIEACYSITGTPPEDTAEMTGAMPPARRKVLWETRRVFFLTPHILQNDLGRGTCSAEDIICLVFDEAHKALGNYAYCQVIKEVAGVKSNFRVLALSATPGGDMNAVQQVVTNLMISQVELRSEESDDIKPYVFGRNVEKIVVPLSSELKEAKAEFLKVLECIVQRLCTQGVCWQHDAGKISKFFLLKARDQFRARGLEDRNRVGLIEGDFALAISLYHAYELLQQHGILSFYNFIKEVYCGTKGTARCRTELMKHEKFMEMMNGLQQRIEPPDDADVSLNGSFFESLTPKRRLLKSIPKPNSLFSSHPKLQKLEEIVVDHFEKSKEKEPIHSSQTPLNTRIMIFSQYRDSVQEITAVLSKHQPLVNVMSFVGQNGAGKGKKGLTQKEQLEVIERFRKGGYNVLVSTSVGEEGLDIGDIDLIICFDASNSPIRLVQRMGRTGRKRAGKIIILVTEGKEDQIYKRSLVNKKSIHKKLADAGNSLVLFDENPRMIPKQLNPFCLKMQFTVKPKQTSSRGVKRKSTDNQGKTSRKKSGNARTETISKRPEQKIIDADEAADEEENMQFEDDGIEFEDSKKKKRNSTKRSKKSTEEGKENRRKKVEDKKEKGKKIGKQEKIDKAKAWRQSTLARADINENESQNYEDFDGVVNMPTKYTEDGMKEDSCDETNKEILDLDKDDKENGDLTKYETTVGSTKICGPSKSIHVSADIEIDMAELVYDQTVAFGTPAPKGSTDEADDMQNISDYLSNSDFKPHFRSEKQLFRESEFHNKREPVPPAPATADLDLLLDDSPGRNEEDRLIDDDEMLDVADSETTEDRMSSCHSSEVDVLGCAVTEEILEMSNDMFFDNVENDVDQECVGDFNEADEVSGPAVKLEGENNELGKVAFNNGKIYTEEDEDGGHVGCGDNNKKKIYSEVNTRDFAEKLYSNAVSANVDCYKSDLEDLDLSTSCLFGDSLCFDEDEFQDCPSPPVVVQKQTFKSVSGKENTGGEYTMLAGVSTSTKLGENSERNVEDKSSTAMHDHDDVVSTVTDGKCMSIGKRPENNELVSNSAPFQGDSLLDCESDENDICDDFPILSLASRLQKKGVLGVEGERTKHYHIDSRNISPLCDTAFEPKIGTSSCSRNSSSLAKVNGKISERKCIDSVKSDNDSEGDSEFPVASLTTRLKNRGVNVLRNESENHIRADDNKGFSTASVSKRPSDNIVGSPNASIGTFNADFNLFSIPTQNLYVEKKIVDLERDESPIKKSEASRTGKHVMFSSQNECFSFRNENIREDRADMNMLSQDETPVAHSKRRKRRVILDDSPVPGKENIEKQDSEDSDEEVCILRRKRKTTKNRVLKSPLAQNVDQTSDEDFDNESAGEEPLQRGHRDGKIITKNASKKKHKGISDFFDDEVEVTDDESGDECDIDCNEYVMDSFIDDATQMTQRTPMRNKKGARSPADMAMVYRQSLFSPMYSALNFGTPAFKANRNKYKMVERDDWQHPSDENDDEAEEVNCLSEVCSEYEEDIFEENSHVISDDADVSKYDKRSSSEDTKPRKKSRVKRIIDTDDDDEDEVAIDKVMNDSGNKEVSAEAKNIENMELNASHYRLVDVSSKLDLEDYGGVLPELQKDCFLPCFDLGLGLSARDFELISCPDEPVISERKPQLQSRIVDTPDLQSRSNGKPALQSRANGKPDLHSRANYQQEKTVKAVGSLEKSNEERPCIFVHTKTVTSSQIGSLLRLKHHIQVTVCSKLGCDFVVSKRMGVLRRLLSDIAHNAKNVEAIKELSDNYSKRCIIIEKDRVKGGSAGEKHVPYSRNYTGLLGNLAASQIKVLFSDSQEETALLISKLTMMENGTDFRLFSSTNNLRNDTLEQLLKVLLTVPHIVYPQAIRICNEFQSLSALMNSTIEEIKIKIPEISTTRAKDIINYFRYNSNSI